MCRILLRELARLNIGLDVYSECTAVDIPELKEAARLGNVRFFAFTYEWNWSRWYGRNRKVAFVISFLKRMRIRRGMVRALVAEHRRKPYDVVIQFSQAELLGLGRYVDEFPIILFPCVHAAGELYWCRREEHLARRCEPLMWRRVRNLYLAYRARLQRRDYKRARGVLGMSRRFNKWVEKDYGLPTDRMGVVYQPIDILANEDSTCRRSSTNVRLLFVGRISVRKGIDLLVSLLPELLRDEPDVEVTLIGAGSLWSSYEPLLASLPTERCRWLRSLPNDQVIEEMRRSDILLVPSYYEPGGIVVAEALANGVIVVGSDEVGSAEALPAEVCVEFAAGDMKGFGCAVAEAVARVRKMGPTLRVRAKEAALRHFSPDAMAQALLGEVQRLLARA